MNTEKRTKRSVAPRLLIHFILSMLLVWGMTVYMSDYFFLAGGWMAVLLVGFIITMLNILVRPVLHLITLPLRLLATFLAFILANALFLWLTLWITDMFDSSIVILKIDHGIAGWILVSIVLGIGHGIIRFLTRTKKD